MSDGRNETSDERLDRELIELLNELRVALPGVQVLFAFLLTLPFTQRFEVISTTQENVYFAMFCTTIVSTAMFMTPTAFHRLRWRRSDKERMLEISNRTAIAGIAFLALSMCGAAYLIADVLFGAGGAAATVAGTAALLGLLWFALPLTRQMRDDGRRWD
jgi:predicted neutral ceramidase superfamily lipid hydrolase